MAVKASAHITLNSVVDIAAYYRYYLLQSSTLSAPSVPTTNPPGGSWGDVEPSYTEGSTNSLYFVDLTVFSDGTWSYSDVSLSSSYEAAKEAYNKAVAAGTAADAAQESADSAQNTADAAVTRITTAESIINTLNATISQFVRDENGTSLVQQDSNGLTYYNLSDIQTAIGNNADDLDALSTLVGAWEEYCETEGNEGTTLTEFVKSLKGTLDAHGLTLEYVRTGTYMNSETGNEEPCIELGESDSDFKLLITNTRIVFMEGSTETTYIKDNTLVTNNVEVKNELRQGNWVWSVRSNGNYGLSWKEV